MLANLETLATFTEGDFRKRFPNFSPPETIANHHIAELGYAVVEMDPEPALSVGETLTPGALRVEDGRVFQAWEVVQPTPGNLTALFEHAIQGKLDGAAVARGYDSIATAVSYAEEPAVPKFQKDGIAFRAWRSLVWAYAYEQLALVLAGGREQPTIEDFLLELPVLELPA